MRDVDYVVIGDTGLIGAALCAHLKQAGRDVVGVHRATYDACRGLRARVVINSNGNTYRFRANQDPVWDFDASVASVHRSLHDLQAELYVYLSTVDVYGCRHDPARNAEDALIETAQLDAYGFHKWVAERLVERYARRSLILRLGTAIGAGLKKGPVYDLLNGLPVHMSLDSELTLIDTRTIADAITALVGRHPEREVFNLTGTGAVRLGEAAERLGVAPVLAPGATEVVHRYDVSNAKLARILALPTSREVLHAHLEACAEPLGPPR